jgi:predicted AAA+ superfamily ATPase
MTFERHILPLLRQHLDRKQITVLTGMRRTGKTTLVKQLLIESTIRQKLYVDLERIDNRALWSENNYETIILALTQRGLRFDEPVLIALDEIQLVPNLPSVLKYLYDTYSIKFVVTGSSAYYLKNQFTESLAGRKKLFDIYPLNFGELLTFRGVAATALDWPTASQFIRAEYERLKGYYEEYVLYGGFPEVVITEAVADKLDLLNDILSSYVNFDILTLADIRNPIDLYKLIRLLAVRIGTKLDVSKLTSLTSMSRPTVENYLDLLEQSYLIRTIPVLAKSPDREIVKARKLYFLDNGIASIAGDLGSGARFENAIFNQLLHKGAVAYYQLKSGREIDFVLDQTLGFEVKETAAEGDLKQLQTLGKNLNLTDQYVIGRHPLRVFESYIWGGSIR